MTFRHFTQVFLLLCLVVAPFNLAKAVDPRIDWKVLETEHFKVVYDSRHYPLAQKYALFAEQSYATLVPIFREAPKKTTLVLNDETDQANGYSTDVPYPLVMLYPVLPTSLDSIGDYGNWGLELVTHEYTHTLNMEPSHGGWGILRTMFGSIMRPNMLLPRWYLEGLAVEMETLYSSYGRLRSPNYLAIARAMVEQGTLRREDISRINESTIPDWPGGARPYLLGALVWSELIQRKGTQIVYDLNEAYSHRFPYAINGPLYRLTGMKYQDLLEFTYQHAEANSKKQIDAIKQAGETSHERFKQEGHFSHSPVISPDGKKLLYIGTNYRNDEVVEMYERNGKETFSTLDAKILAKSDSINRASWFPDSQSFVFDKIDDYNRYYEFYDLYKYDFAKKKAKRITKGLRAYEPVVSSDGKRIFFVQNAVSTARLSSVDANGENLIVHYEPPFQGRVARPEFLNQDEIVFSQKNDDGAEILVVLNLKTNATRKILEAYAPAHFPRMTPKGLVFVSDKSGVANLMIADSALKTARPLTNITTRAMTAEYDSQADEWIYSRLFSEGPQLVRMVAQEAEKAPKQLPQVGSLVDYQWPQHTPPQIEAKYEEKDYSVWPYMVPRYWMPWVYTSSVSNYYSASTSAADPLGKHAYSVSVFYDDYPHKPGFYASYLNHTTDLFIQLDGDDEYDLLTTDTLRHTTAGQLTASGYIPGLSNDWTAGLGWRYDQTQIELSSTQVRNGPQVFFAYSNFSQKGVEISPESGGALRASYTKFLSGLGNVAYDRIDASGRLYFSKWLPDRHVITPSIRATVEPGLKNTLLGPSSSAYGQVENVLSTRHVMRGYEPSVFIGRNMLSSSLEYRFPVADWYKGLGGTFPVFVKRFHGAVVGDALTTDGYYFDQTTDVYRRTRIGGRMFVSAGLEARADATIGYHVPVTLVVGGYYGFDQKAGTRNVIPFLGFAL